jgi:hypothetical protein
MDHDHLIGQVQHRARVTSRGEAEVAVPGDSPNA